MKWIVLLGAGLLVGSCFSEGDCLVTATNVMEIQFKKKSDKTIDSTMVFTSISISGTTTSTDTVITSALLLPVDINHDTTMFVMKRFNNTYTVTGTDTLVVTYARQSKVITRDCGAFTFFSNLKIVKKSLADSQVKIFSTSLIKDPTSSAYAVNFQIFY